MQSYTRFIFVLLIFVVLRSVPSAGQLVCQIDGVTDSQWLIQYQHGFNDTDIGITFQRPTTNIEGILSVTFNDNEATNPYISATHETGIFTVTLLDEFINYEQNEFATEIIMTITFRCTQDTRTLVMRLNIRDTNNHFPEFQPNENIVFRVFEPIPAGLVLTPAFGNILARDVDLTTSQIIFAFEEQNELFDIIYSSRDGKNFIASLTVKVPIIKLPDNPTFRISATDVDLTGDPPITVFGTITLEVDPNLSIPTAPVFSEPFFTARYNASTTGLHFDSTITIGVGYNENLTYYLTGDYSNFFSVRNADSTVIIETNGIPDDVIAENDFLLFVVVANITEAIYGNAVIQVAFPRDPLLVFEQLMYDGAYDGSTLSIAPASLVRGYTPDVIFDLAGDDSRHFTLNPLGNSVSFGLNGPIPEDILENRAVLSFTLTASINSNLGGNTAINVALPEKDILQFEYSSYEGSIHNGILNIPTNITLSGLTENTQVSISGEFHEAFKAQLDGNTILLELVEPENTDLLNSKFAILSIDVETNANTKASATLVIDVVQDPLHFEHPLYEGLYSIDTHIVRFPPISFSESIPDDVGVKFGLTGDYREYFDAEFDNGNVLVSVTRALPVENIVNVTHIHLVLEASIQDVRSSHTVLSITLPTVVLIFEQLMYDGTYDGTSLNIVPARLIEESSQGVTFDLLGDDSQYFTITSQNNSVVFGLNGPIPQDILESRTVLSFTLTASVNNSNLFGNTAINVALPEKNILLFEHPIYEGSINNETLTIPAAITLTSGVTGSSQVSLSGEFHEAFRAQLQGNTILVELLEPEFLGLPNSKFVVLSINVETNANINASAALVIDVIQDIQVPLHFEQPLYEGSYSIDPVDLHFPLITFTESIHDNIVFELTGDYREYFDAEFDNGNVLVSVTRSLPVENIVNVTHIHLVLEASIQDVRSSHTVLSITLTTVVLIFEQLMYDGTYDGTSLNIVPARLIEESSQGVTFDLLGDDSQYFTITPQNNSVVFGLNGPIPQDILESRTVLSFTLTASVNNSNLFGNTAINVALPEKNILLFEHPIYEGSINNETLTIPAAITLTSGVTGSSQVSLSGEFHEAFRAQLQGNTILVELLEPEFLGLPNSKFVVLSINVETNANINASAALVIDVIQDIQVPLHFEQPLYEGSYSIDPVDLHFPLITFTESIHDNIVFELTGDYREYFDAEFDNGNVLVSVTRALPVENIVNVTHIHLVLEASIQDVRSSHTVLSITLPTVVLIFEQLMYDGTYDGTSLNIVPARLIEESSQGVTFDLLGDDSQYFTITPQNNSVVFGLNGPIPQDILESRTVLSFTLTASVNNSNLFGNTAVNVALPEKNILLFEHPIYEGSINNETLTIPAAITLTSGVTGSSQVSLSGEFHEAFRAQLQGNTILVELLEPEFLGLPNSKFVVLSINVETNANINASAALVIDVIQDIQVPLHFEQPLYEGSYSIDPVDLHFPLITFTESIHDNIVFELTGDYREYFDAEFDNGNVLVSVTRALPVENIVNVTHIHLVLEASIQDVRSSHTVLSITLPTVVLIFEQLMYDGTYDGTSLNIVPARLIEESSQGVTFDLLGDDSQYFTITPQNNSVVFGLNGPIPQDILESRTVLSFTLTASVNNSNLFGNTAINVALPEKNILLFEHPIYEGSINNETLTIPAAITLTSGVTGSSQVSLSGEFHEAFRAQLQGNTILVELLEPEFLGLPNSKFVVLSINVETNANINASAALVIDVIQDIQVPLHFEQPLYEGSYSIDPVDLHFPLITFTESIHDNIVFELTGDYREYFDAEFDNVNVFISVRNALPTEIFLNVTHIHLLLEASIHDVRSSVTVLSIILPTVDSIILFEEQLYTGAYTLDPLEVNLPPINFSVTHESDIILSIDGDYKDYFEATLVNKSVEVNILNALPSEVINEESQIVLILGAAISNVGSGHTTIVLRLPNIDLAAPVVFDQHLYEGKYSEGVVELPPINIVGGYEIDVEFSLDGELSDYFTAVYTNGQVEITSYGLPDNLVDSESYITLTLHAIKPEAITSFSVIVLSLTKENNPEPLHFEHPLYEGTYSTDPLDVHFPPISFTESIHDNVTLMLFGEYREHFDAQLDNENVLVSIKSALPDGTVIGNVSHILLMLEASIGDVRSTLTVLSITLPTIDSAIEFEEQLYTGVYSLDPIEVKLPPIAFSVPHEGDIILSINGDYKDYFEATLVNKSVEVNILNALPSEVINEESQIVLILGAAISNVGSGHTTIVLRLPNIDLAAPVVFDQHLYEGKYSEGVVELPPINIVGGYEINVEFSLDGELSDYFTSVYTNGQVEITSNGLPDNLTDSESYISLTLRAIKPEAITSFSVIVLSLTKESSSETALSFEQPLYEGIYEESQLLLPRIVFNPTNIDPVTFAFSGAHSEYFTAVGENGVVAVSATLPSAVSSQNQPLILVLEAATAQIGKAHTVLHINVKGTEEIVEEPIITFGSLAYEVTVEPTYTGDLLTVSASTNTGESVTYELNNLTDHLSPRLHIDSRSGLISLSAFANTGDYQVTIRATTTVTQVNAMADLRIIVNDGTICNANDYRLDPLTILDIIEEQSYSDVVTLNEEMNGECRYVITKQWPSDQAWFFTDDKGGISCMQVNREHHSIAFMTLSQVYLELELTCNDGSTALIYNNTLPRKTTTRINSNGNSSLSASRASEEGTLKWIIAENIHYSTSHRVVNIIVEDINDNPPIFVQSSPLAIGYPVDSLTDALMPPYLTTVLATDADIGINAKIRYSTDSNHFTIHPETGIIYPLESFPEPLANGASFTVYAIDEDGRGPHTTPLTIQVNLLDRQHISLLSVKGAFLETLDEVTAYLSQELSLQVKSLKSAVLPENVDINRIVDGNHYKNVRNDDNVTEGDVSEIPADNENLTLLRIYVYAFDNQRNLILAEVLSERIESELSESDEFSFNIVSVPLPPEESASGGNSNSTFLLYTVIILSVLLVLMILFNAGWYLWKNRKSKYGQFNDTSSNNDSENSSNSNTSVVKRIVHASTVSAADDRERLSTNLERILTPAPNVTLQNEVTESLQQRNNNPAPISFTESDAKRTQTVANVYELDEDEFGEIKSPIKKTVVFNEVVESIQIEKDDDDDEIESYQL